MPNKLGIVKKYWSYLPVSKETPVISLLEGDTPLISSQSIGPDLGVDLYFKYEGLNPTGSFKDRGMTLAVSKAVEDGAKAVICASTGNTSASAAAYAAHSGLKCVVVIPEGKIASGKLAQAIAHQALVIAVKGNFDKALEIVRQLSEEYPLKLVNSINPYRLEGQKTSAFEICDQLGEAPDYLCIPVGNAGNITAYWMGFRQYYQSGKISSQPRMIGFQAKGAAPIVLGHPVENPTTIATAIRIGNPVRWQQAVAAAEESNGFIDMVSDEEILMAYQRLASQEGIFVEPASAASVAGLVTSVINGRIARGKKIVCVLTGHGLKDPGSVDLLSNKVNSVDPSLEAVRDIIFSS